MTHMTVKQTCKVSATTTTEENSVNIAASSMRPMQILQFVAQRYLLFDRLLRMRLEP